MQVPLCIAASQVQIARYSEDFLFARAGALATWLLRQSTAGGDGGIGGGGLGGGSGGPADDGPTRKPSSRHLLGFKG